MKKSTSLFLFLLTFALAFQTLAQNTCSFFQTYPNEHIGVVDAVESPDGGYRVKTLHTFYNLPDQPKVFANLTTDYKGEIVQKDSIELPSNYTVWQQDGFLSVSDWLLDTIVVRRYNPNGVETSSFVYQDNRSESIFATGIFEDNGAVYVYGILDPVGYPMEEYTPFLVRFDGAGNLIWRKVWAFSGPGTFEFLNKTSDGEYYLLLTYNNYFSGKLLIKTNENGDYLWQHPMDYQQSIGHQLVESFDGQRVFLPITQGISHIPGNQAQFECLNAQTGLHQWSWAYWAGLPDEDWFVTVSRGALALSDGFLITLTNNAMLTNPNGIAPNVLYIVRLDLLGNMLWYKRVAGEGIGGFPTQQTADGGFLLVGQKDGVGPFLMKTDSLGNILPACLFSEASLLLQTDQPYLWPNDTVVFDLRFQNIGFSATQNVLLSDPLGSYFDATTVQVLASSHPVQVSTDINSATNFLFENINLPPSLLDSAGSKGFVRISARLREDLLEGSTVYNQFLAIFDGLEPVSSNETVQQIKTIQHAGVDLVHCGDDPYPVFVPWDTIDYGASALIIETGVQDFSYLSQTQMVTLQAGTVFMGVVITGDTLLLDTVPSVGWFCPTVVRIHVMMVSAAADMGLDGDFAVFPNPANNTVFVKTPMGEPCKVLIVNALGKNLASFENLPSLGGLLELDISGIPNGQYFVVLEVAGRGRVVRKLVVMRGI